MTTTLTAPEYVEVTAYLARKYQGRFADRVKLACVLAGNVGLTQLARAMSEHTGVDYTRNQVVNLAGRSDPSTNRSRITLGKVEDVVSTFAERYGLCYARKDGSAGRPVDVEWFVAANPTMLVRRDIPGYLSDLTLAA